MSINAEGLNENLNKLNKLLLRRVCICLPLSFSWPHEQSRVGEISLRTVLPLCCQFQEKSCHSRVIKLTWLVGTTIDSTHFTWNFIRNYFGGYAVNIQTNPYLELLEIHLTLINQVYFRFFSAWICLLNCLLSEENLCLFLVTSLASYSWIYMLSRLILIIINIAVKMT